MWGVDGLSPPTTHDFSLVLGSTPSYLLDDKLVLDKNLL